MTSGISSLGLGSSGILSSNLIDKLKSADEKSLVTPIQNKITTVESKITGIESISGFINSLQSSISDLSNHVSLSQKSVNNNAISVESGVLSQDLSIKVLNLASNDMYQSNIYTSTTSLVSNTQSNTPLSISLNNKDYSFNIDNNTTLDDLKNKINDTSDNNLIANILNVGNNEYRLIIKTTNTGDNNKITFSGDATILNNLGVNNATNHIKTANNASFEFNGITISRNTNSINDLITGVTINLNDSMKTLTNISITDNMDNLTNSLNTFVDTYNKLNTYLNDNTKYNMDTKTSSLFQNESSIKSLKKSLSDMYYNNTTFLNKLGIEKIDNNLTINKSISNNISNTTKNSLNKTNYFNELNDLLLNYDTDKSNSYLSTYKLSLKSQETKLNNNLSITNAMLTNRYDMMTKRFASYDSLISKYTSSFDVLNNIIQQTNKN